MQAQCSQTVHVETSCAQAIVQEVHMRSVFGMSGLALQDLTVARMLQEHAYASGAGTSVS